MFLEVLSRGEWLAVHLPIWAGLILICVWLGKYWGTSQAHRTILMVIWGIICIFAGFCFMAAFALQHLAP